MHSIIEFLQAYGWLIGVPLLFIAIVAWVFRPGARARYQRDGDIPFEDADVKQRTNR